MGRLTLTHLTFTGPRAPSRCCGQSMYGDPRTQDTNVLSSLTQSTSSSARKNSKRYPSETATIGIGLELPGGDASPSHAQSMEEPSASPNRPSNGTTGRRMVSLLRSTAQQRPRTCQDSCSNRSALTRNLCAKRAQRNEHAELRDLTKLCLVGETKMQAEEAPAISGNPVNKTKEVSVLETLSHGRRRFGNWGCSIGTRTKAVARSSTEVVERMLGQLEGQLKTSPNPPNLGTSSASRNRALKLPSRSRRSRETKGTALADRTRIEREELAHRVEYSDAAALRQRFDLLLRQYESDLARLENDLEAGNLLGYFRKGTCFFCGAEPASQHLNVDCRGIRNSFGLSVGSETLKTRGPSHEDLVVTIESLKAQARPSWSDQNSTHEGLSRIQNEVEGARRKNDTLIRAASTSFSPRAVKSRSTWDFTTKWNHSGPNPEDR